MSCNCCYCDDGSEPTIYVTPETRVIVQEYLRKRQLRKKTKKLKPARAAVEQMLV